MIPTIALLLMLGQQPISSPSKEEACLMEHTKEYCAVMYPAPLKCEKGEHLQRIGPHITWDKCGEYEHLEKVHVVTEREWQEMLDRIKKLEAHAPYPYCDELADPSGASCIRRLNK